MIEINFLPWREGLKKKAVCYFYVEAILFLLGMIFVFGLSRWGINERIAMQKKSRGEIEKSAFLLEDKIKKYQFLTKAYHQFSQQLFYLLRRQLFRKQLQLFIQEASALKKEALAVEKIEYREGAADITGDAVNQKVLDQWGFQLQKTALLKEAKPVILSFKEGKVSFLPHLSWEKFNDVKENPRKP